jgi:ribosome-associated toxin RatA of RatAB toxin-antitoxin module
MSELKFLIELPCEREKLFEVVINYQNYPKIFPDQIKEMSIMKNSEILKTTKEIFVFRSIIQKEIVQESEHKIKKPESIESKIISGPFKNSVMRMDFQNSKEKGTIITISGDLRIGFKFKILSPIIKKYYKSILTSLFFKMNNMLTNS